MNVTLLEVHLDDVAVAVSGGTEAAASTDTESVEASESEEAGGGLPRAVLALVPVFVVLGVAAGFLAARRFGRDDSGLPDDAAHIEVEPELH